MSDDETPDLGPRPDPVVEPGEPDPGGVDAVTASDGVDGESASDPVPRDLDPDDNTAVEDVLPEEMKQREDTSTAATKDDEATDDVAPAEESPV